jgi:nitroimidazol reductase NimA-like FMN-containing flavoprotein (pyridoxamine 5'-phosphate oxidase superfamily)
MKLAADNTGVEVIPTDGCLALLATEEIGRLGVVVGGQPHVVPVNYALDGDAVVFRSADGTKLDGASRSSVVFEVDHFDRDTRSGWSVIVHGRAEEVTSLSDPALVSRVARLDVQPWADFPKDHVVRIVPRSITGRRVG